MKKIFLSVFKIALLVALGIIETVVLISAIKFAIG